METIGVLRSLAVPMPARHHQAARRYIGAFVERDPHARLGSRFVHWRTEQLWERFLAEYGESGKARSVQDPDQALLTALMKL